MLAKSVPQCFDPHANRKRNLCWTCEVCPGPFFILISIIIFKRKVFVNHSFCDFNNTIIIFSYLLSRITYTHFDLLTGNQYLVKPIYTTYESSQLLKASVNQILYPLKPTKLHIDKIQIRSLR